MNFKRMFYFLLMPACFLAGCGECEKLNLNQTEKDWVSHFKKGEIIFYKNTNGQIDTLEIKDTSNYYTSCNKIELSYYQYEIYLVLYKFKSKNNYNGEESSISISTQESEQRMPYIHLCNLGPHRNDLENKAPVLIDTVLGGVKLSSVYYYAKGLNTEQYGTKEYFKNFFWNKQSGLVAYTTINDELFLLVNQ